MNTIKFNTGRGYSANGQTIIARLLENGEVVFVDLARNINGRITLGCLDIQFINAIFDHHYVLGCYDRCDYVDESNSELINELKAF